MADIRTRLCFALSRRLMRPPAERTVDYQAYGDWRTDSLSRSWAAFSDSYIAGKDVLDFGCGDGQLSFFLAKEKHPRRILGIDINAPAIARAKASIQDLPTDARAHIDFSVGSTEGLPVPDQSFDTLIALDCLEHVMSPGPILRDWCRVLRPGGRCLIQWFPYKGPWGPHMEDKGNKKPNKWRAWSSFKEQAYINELDIRSFQNLSRSAGLDVARLELHSFGGSRTRQALGRMLMAMPVAGEYFVSFAIIELLRPELS